MLFLAMLISFYCFYLVNRNAKNLKQDKNDFNARPLQLQAYERIVMLAERISLPNLVSRANQPGFKCAGNATFILESIKQEVEYNTPSRYM